MIYLILFSSLIGFLLSFHIYRHKYQKKVLVCPLKAKCDPVIHSEYSKFLGVENTILGMLYYYFIFIFYLFYTISGYINNYFEFIIFSLSILAVLFSIYLTFIQLFKLRQICSWCLLSALLCIVILFSSYIIYKDSIIQLASQFKNFSIFIHALSAGIGLGVVSVVDYLFFKFLKDKKIDQKEKEILDGLSDFIWLILAFIVVSGIFIYFSDIQKYHSSTKFIFKMIIIFFIIINGFLMNLIISPKLINLDFDKLTTFKERLALSMGIVSLVSWYLAFLLGRLKSLPLELGKALMLYFIFLFVSIFLLNILFHKFMKIKGY
jgi:uncharacterized membrane protein